MRTASTTGAGALPNADISFIKGQNHNVPAKVLAPLLMKFFLEKSA
jgi:hypothetical protein